MLSDVLWSEIFHSCLQKNILMHILVVLGPGNFLSKEVETTQQTPILPYIGDIFVAV